MYPEELNLSLDLLLLKLLNLKLAHPFFDPLMKGISELKYWWPVFTGLSFLILWRKGKEAPVIIGLTLVCYMLSEFISYDLVKPFFRRERPCQVLPWVRLVMSFCPKSPSFPSTHVANSFSVAFFLSFYFPKARALFLGVAALVGVSRIYLGVHYPSDVLGGALIGMGISWTIRYLYEGVKRWAKRKSSRPCGT